MKKYQINNLLNYNKTVLRAKSSIITLAKKLLIKIIMKPYIVWIFYTLVLLIWNTGIIYAEEKIPDHIPEIFEKERQEWYKVNHDENHGRWSKSEQVFHRYKNPKDADINLVESDGYRDNNNNWVKNPPLPYNFINYYEKARLLKAWQEKCAIADGNDIVQSTTVSSEIPHQIPSNIPVDTTKLSNETLDTESNSSSSSESNILERYSSVIILNNYALYISECKTPEQVVITSMEFMRTQFPEQLLAKTEAELGSAMSLVNLFQDKILQEITINSDEDLLTYISFRSAISTYNSGYLLHILDNHVLLKEVYEKTMQNILDNITIL